MNLSMDIQTINIPNLIKSGQYYQQNSIIKNYEDTLQKLLSNNKDTAITNEPYAFIWKVNSELFPDFKNNIVDAIVELFGEKFSDLDDRVIVTGPFVRSCLVSNENIPNTVKVIKELYLYRCCDEEWQDILDLEIFTDAKTQYTYDDETKKVFLIKKKYKHPAHIILQHDYLKRVGFCNGDFYASSMFLIEMQKHFNLLNSKFRDPILNLPYDPLKIYQVNDKDKTHPIKIIDRVDIDELTNLSKKNFVKLFGSKTCIELCLDKLKSEDHPVLVGQLKQMIIYLGGVSTKRPPYLYAKVLGINQSMPEVYTYLKALENQYNLPEIVADVKTLDDINTNIINLLILNDSVENFFDYVNFVKLKISKSVIDTIVKNNSLKIIEYLIKNKLVDTHLSYYLIFMSENFDLVEQQNFSIDIDIAINYLKDILQNGKARSFFYLFDRDPSIINTLFEDNKNILHMVKLQKNFKSCSDLIELIIKLKPELLNLKDSNKETPIVYHAKHDTEIVKIFLEYEFDYTLGDSSGNCFIHNLCQNNGKEDCYDILKLALKRCPELIDMPNKKSETPMIICCKNNLENMFYVLKGLGANMDAQDLYGNTVSHYICSNSMCLGMIIENKQNYFGLTPSDYCKVSDKYYNFLN